MQKERVRINHKSGTAYTPQRTVNYEGRLAGEAQRAMKNFVPFSGPVRVKLTLLMPVAESWSAKKKAAALKGELMPTGRPDLDNVGKLLDACNMIVFNDDKQVCDFHMIKKYSLRPGLELVIETM